MIFQKGQKIDKYIVVFPHKQGSYAETYRVKNEQGKVCFLKLINLTKLSSSQIDGDGNVVEIEIVKKLNHNNICSYIDNGNIIHNGQQLYYFVSKFISGETLAQRMERDRTLSVYEMKQIVLGVLSALKFLHSQPSPIVHNEVTIQNIMLDLSGSLSDVKLIDFGYARYLNEANRKQDLDGLNLFYLAPERLRGTYCIQSDLYSVGVMMYHLLYGALPYYTDLSGMDIENQIAKITRERNKILKLPDENLFEMDEQLINILKKAICNDIEDRFISADEFIKALNGKIDVENPDLNRKIVSNTTNTNVVRVTPAKGQGFAAIAGMQDLKTQLQEEVIDVLNNPEEYARYGLSIPNGMLLYGPPGCGKTFFAKHFAEEVGFNFMFVTPSTLKSRYVNASGENIAQMFRDAEENAPTIIFIDEINELVPNRDSDVHEMSRSAVNEMLAQMDRTGERGIFIIGATNYPDMIDPAILRSGRLDKKYYLAPPDKDARMAMFELHLKKRPYDFGLDFNRLAELTENYVASDIELIVNNSARIALKSKSKITMKILEETIRKTQPSLTIEMLNKFANMRKFIEGIQTTPKERKKVGFI